MRWLRFHWFDVGAVIGVVLLAIGIGIRSELAAMQVILWVSLLTLFAHQFEEWRWPGWFPGALNIALFRSDRPDRYPLDSWSGFVVNVVVGWGGYVLAAVLWSHALWLAVATMLVSIGNAVFHLVLMPIRARIPYNPGMVTSAVLFVPCSIWFFVEASRTHLLTGGDLLLGIPLGIVLNAVGVVGVIMLLRDRDAEPFPDRMIAPARARIHVPA